MYRVPYNVNNQLMGLPKSEIHTESCFLPRAIRFRFRFVTTPSLLFATW